MTGVSGELRFIGKLFEAACTNAAHSRSRGVGKLMQQSRLRPLACPNDIRLIRKLWSLESCGRLRLIDSSMSGLNRRMSSIAAGSTMLPRSSELSGSNAAAAARQAYSISAGCWTSHCSPNCEICAAAFRSGVCLFGGIALTAEA